MVILQTLSSYTLNTSYKYCVSFTAPNFSTLGHSMRGLFTKILFFQIPVCEEPVPNPQFPTSRHWKVISVIMRHKKFKIIVLYHLRCSYLFSKNMRCKKPAI